MPVGRFKKPSRLRPGIPPSLDDVVMRCLEPRKEDRYPDAAVLRAALDGGKQQSALWMWAMAAGLLAVLAFAGGVYYRSKGHATPAPEGPAKRESVATEKPPVPPDTLTAGAAPQTLPESDATVPLKASTAVAMAAPVIPVEGETRIFAAMEFVWIPPGEFMMGSPNSEKGRYDNETPQHKRTIKEGFWLGKFEVTQEQWRKVMGNNPSYFKGDFLPVEQVSWDDCQQFVAKLSRPGQGIFRLPSEAEWEYACRAGAGTRYYWGPDPAYSQIREYAWYDACSEGRTHPGGLKRPNAWNLYDMAGNVWEWCEDDYHESYHGAPRDGRAWVDIPRVSTKVPRGGSWETQALNCRTTDRGHNPSDTRRSNRGVRLVRLP
ncbi:MAG: Serine/threonine-protein kinase pkn1 [Candidatus Hydrogenedentes bacterium ADurb.Bin179]|nr:MAG: Serine/threonine-protein kinase pkn1 [Candidatus Hydrogenedentes bacterium ADurb.Bin179]